MGLDSEKESDAKQYFILMHNRFMKNAEILWRKSIPTPACSSTAVRRFTSRNTTPTRHFEMEDLPTSWGGYDKMPLRAKYFSKSGKQYLGMTGKFHRAWGEFGGFKAPQALRYEVAAMMSFGAGCSVGDQLHPCGKMDSETYQLIGQAYNYARQIEPYCFGMETVPGLGLYLSRNKDANEGISKALLDAHKEFDVITDNCFEQYEAMLIPEGPCWIKRRMGGFGSTCKTGVGCLHWGTA